MRGDFARGLVDDLVLHGRNLADTHLNCVLLRLEFPGQTRGHVGIEPNGERPVENLIGCLFRDLGGATETGCPAKPVIERHRRIGCADHAGDNCAAARGNEHVAAHRLSYGLLIGVAETCGHRFQRFVHQMGRIRTPGPFTSVIT